MMQQVRLWLPAATQGEAEAAVMAIISRWMDEWLVGEPAVTIAACPSSALRQRTWFGNNGVLIGAEEGMTVQLGAAVCGGSADIENRRDRAILGRLGDTATNDLAAKFGAIEAEQQADAGAAPDWAVQCFIASAANRAWSVAIVLSDEAFISLRRRRAVSGTAPVLGRIVDSLGQERCRLGLHLGRASIDASDLAALGPGDVIVLDQSLRAALPLLVDDRPVQGGQAVLEPGEATLMVAIAASPSLSLEKA